ncbi:MAG TPA: hypothetical protein VMU01_08580 [Rhizomicrobium sp.]|nr:hypothetical protein [Rhizomicrobium sp.]
MTMEKPPAAGQGGNEPTPSAPPREIAPAPQSQMPAARQPRAHPSRDEGYRQITVEDLALALTRSDALLAHCEALARAAYGDPLGPVHAAARLMNAKAQVAKALAQVAQVERRSRTIVETIQMPDPENAGLNATFASPQQRKKIRDVLERALLQFLDEQKHDRERREGLAIGCCI